MRFQVGSEIELAVGSHITSDDNSVFAFREASCGRLQDPSIARIAAEFVSRRAALQPCHTSDAPYKQKCSSFLGFSLSLAEFRRYFSRLNGRIEHFQLRYESTIYRSSSYVHSICTRVCHDADTREWSLRLLAGTAQALGAHENEIRFAPSVLPSFHPPSKAALLNAEIGSAALTRLRPYA